MNLSVCFDTIGLAHLGEHFSKTGAAPLLTGRCVFYLENVDFNSKIFFISYSNNYSPRPKIDMNKHYIDLRRV